MRTLDLIHALPVSRLILRSASFLVPKSGRAEWLAEWKAELWQVCRARNGKEPGDGPEAPVRGGQEVTAFCLGAFPDALWLRRNHPRPAPRLVFRAGSAPRCGLFLAVWAVASMLVCFCLSGTRRALLPLPYRDAGSLAIVSSGGYSGIQLPAVKLADYQSWRINGGNVFREVAFYQPALQKVFIENQRTAALSIARASDNLFEVLNLPLSGTAANSNGPQAARMVLSWSAWQRLFRGDPDVAGQVVQIGGHPVLIAGILPEDFWRLPGQTDAWMLEDEHGLNALPPESKGFVIAHLKTSGFPAQPEGLRSIHVTRAGGGVDQFNCISLAWQSGQLYSIFLFALFLAFLALPATTPLPLGDYPECGNRLTRSIRARRWVFLAAKFALVVPTVFFCSVDLAYSRFAPASSAALYIQLATSFFGLLFAFRWALRDQRKRCPVCLRLLSNPARVGQASRNFLAWNGTELICSRGHGLLHIPELPTSWCGTQRWLYLDSSWRGLFSDAYINAAGAV